MYNVELSCDAHQDRELLKQGDYLLPGCCFYLRLIFIIVSPGRNLNMLRLSWRVSADFHIGTEGGHLLSIIRKVALFKFQKMAVNSSMPLSLELPFCVQAHI